jgi:hypothetical protein
MEEDHKALVAGIMLGTMSDLNKIDGMITSSSSTLGKRAEVVKNDLAKFLATTTSSPVVSQPQVQPPVIQPTQPQATSQVNFMQVVGSVTPIDPATITTSYPIKVEDTPQLEFDFDKRAKYQDLVYKIEDMEDRMNDTFDELFEKLNEISQKLDAAPKPKREYKKKVDGSQN